MKKIIAYTVLAFTSYHAIAQTTTGETGSKLLIEAKAAIAKGNAQWAEGWRRGDAAMVSAIFEDDGVQLSLSGKVIKGRQQIEEVQKKGM